jgi:nitrite reductase (NADH) large subunit
LNLRRISARDGVSVFTDEEYLYYPRPSLYSVLSGRIQPQQIISPPEQWYANQGIKVALRKKVTKVDASNRSITFEDGTKIAYDKLLLANGAYPFIPPVKGAEKKGVFVLRTLDHALAIRQYAGKTRNAVVIGGGLLGLEFAASLRKLGQAVNVLEVSPRLLPNQLDEDGSSVFQKKIENMGINIMLNVRTNEILGEENVSGVSLSDGRTLPGDLILFSAGIRSNIELAREAGIKVNRGIVVDGNLQTSLSDIYAAGDAAEFREKVYGIIPAAEEQARIAATNMIGLDKHEYQGTMPSSTVKIAGIDLTCIGTIIPQNSQQEEIKKLDAERGSYKKIVLQEGRIIGAIILGDVGSVAPIKRLIAGRVGVSKFKNQVLEDNFNFSEIGE